MSPISVASQQAPSGLGGSPSNFGGPPDDFGSLGCFETGCLLARDLRCMAYGVCCSICLALALPQIALGARSKLSLERGGGGELHDGWHHCADLVGSTIEG
ncbi:MAG TPA: hypothetical protein PK020_07780 [Ilumatobacteraceae bacterium]|nr:hypothetical protein [Ilumatobacteraceae bacterium]HRB02124.1 hypothetical protein [Ilumatobacteraceae bacterium]